MTRNNTKIYVTLEILNDEETIKRIPAIVYLSIVLILGIAGNLLVIVVYYGALKRKVGAHWTFIRSLAVTDFMVCAIVIPFELYQQTHQLTFYAEWGCKFFRAVSVHLSIMSSVLLIIMSANRLRRACQPLKRQLTAQQAFVCVIAVAGFVVLFSWPEAVLSGKRVLYLDYNLTGYDCSFSNHFEGKPYTTLYSVVLLIGFVGCIVALIIIYSIIGWQVLRSRLPKYPVSTVTPSVSGESSFGLDSDGIDRGQVGRKRLNDDTRESTDERTRNKFQIIPTKSATSSRKSTSKKITKIAFVISFCFVLSYLPYIAVKLNGSLVKGQYNTNDVTKGIFPILTRLFIINNIVNSVIYWCLDSTFRENCKLLFKRLTGRI